MTKISHILLIDDDKTTNFLNQLLLENLGVTDQVLVAENGQEALTLLESRSEIGQGPALILLDINMPVMNGFEFLEAYQQLTSAHEHTVVIVMLTTSLGARDMSRLEQLPVQGFLHKPLRPEMVHTLLKQHFSIPLPS
jgi:CheY-like chemotaxis protein